MQLGTVVVAKRFLGPPNSGNGGYSCGRVAAFVEGDAEVTLRRPPPLDTPMSVVSAADGNVELYSGDELIAYAHATSVDTPDIAPPGFAEAEAAATRTFHAERHPLPTCFVCGPHREPGDGLRIHVGPVDPDDDDNWSGVLAAPWIPHPSLADEAGVVRPEFVWAALDCPTAYASSTAAGMRTILLGRQAVRIVRRPAAGERCVVATRQTGHDGRKYFAEAGLYDENGAVLAAGRATWIEVSPEVQKGGRGKRSRFDER